MPNWKEILDETKSVGSPHDIVRRKYIEKLASKTGRNVIVYYSGWLQKPQASKLGFDFGINDSDKSGFMTCIHNMPRSKGLDLVLHTPGGDIAAVESLVDYLRKMFGTNIRAIVPQIAMSAGTMIACASKQILMGKHSNLGPIDPQIAGIPAQGIIEEFKRAKMEVAADPNTIPIWQAIIAKYPPSLLGGCVKAIKWSDSLVTNWLETGMFSGTKNKVSRARKIVNHLGSHQLNLSHARHLNIDDARKLGLKIISLEKNPAIQDAVLSVHHSCIVTLSGPHALKIIENNLGVSYINIAQ